MTDEENPTLKEILEVKRLLTQGSQQSIVMFVLSMSIAAMVLALTFIPPVPVIFTGIVLFIVGAAGLWYAVRLHKRTGKQ